MKYIGYGVGIIFIGMGLYFIVQPHIVENFSYTQQRLFGMLLVLYGIFRSYKVFQKQKNNTDQEP